MAGRRGAGDIGHEDYGEEATGVHDQADDSFTGTDDDPFASWFEPGAATQARPVTSASPAVASDEDFELQDWDAPATGHVPRVIASGESPTATSRGPIYRGQSSTHHDEPLDFGDLADDHLAVGALNQDPADAVEDWDIDGGWESSDDTRRRPRPRDPMTEIDRSPRSPAPGRARGSRRPPEEDHDAGGYAPVADRGRARGTVRARDGFGEPLAEREPPPAQPGSPRPGGRRRAAMAEAYESAAAGPGPGARPGGGGGTPPGRGPRPGGRPPQGNGRPPRSPQAGERPNRPGGGPGRGPQGARGPARGPQGPGPQGRGAQGPANEEMGFGPQGAGSDRDLGTAALVGVGIIAVAVLCFVLGHFWTMLLITAAIMLAAVEFFGALHKGGYQPASLVGLAGTFGLLWGSYFRLSWAWPAVLALVLVATLLWFLIVTPGEQTVMNAAVTVLGVVYVGGLGSFAALLAGMDRQLSAAAADTQKVFVWVILAAAVSAVSYDVAGYFFGRSLGRTPLGPALRAASPNKTQEGMIAGVTISIIVTFVVLLIAKLSAFGEGGLSTRTALFAIGCALVAPLGDLCESALKRDLGVKDMGTTLPGHGGALDRFDALLFVLPVAYFVVTSFR